MSKKEELLKRVDEVWDSPTYEKKDDSHHRVRKTGIKTETCLDCGQEIKIHVERLEDELHTYVNGKCQLCHNEKKLMTRARHGYLNVAEFLLGLYEG